MRINKYCVFVLFFSAIVSSSATETIIIRPITNFPSQGDVGTPENSYDMDADALSSFANIKSQSTLIVRNTSTPFSDIGFIRNIYIKLYHSSNDSSAPGSAWWVINTSTQGPQHFFVTSLLSDTKVWETIDVTNDINPWLWNYFTDAQVRVYNPDPSGVPNPRIRVHDIYFSVVYSSWPVIQKAETMDQNQNGKIDTYKLTFNLPMKDSTLQINWFQIDGQPTAAFDTGSFADDNLIYLRFAENAFPDTSQVPDVTYNGPVPGGFESMDGAPLRVVTSTDVVEEDKAGPVIVSAVANDNNGGVLGIQTYDFVTLTFSEDTNMPLISTSNINTALVLNNCAGACNWLSGDGSLISAQWLSPSVLKITLSSSGGPPTLSENNTIITPSGIITDLAVNQAAGNVLLTGNFASDSTPPEIFEARTADLDNDGFIDAIRLLFSEPVIDALATANFTVSGPVSISGFTTGATPNDSEIYLTFTDGRLNTGEIPALTYQQNSLPYIEDQAGNDMFPVSVLSLDYASPVLIKAEANDDSTLGAGIQTGDTVRLTFSENTNQPFIASNNIASYLQLNPATHTWLSGSDIFLEGQSGWLSASAFLVTLSTEGGSPVLVPSMTIITSSASIRDWADNPVTGNAILLGNFGANAISPLLRRLETADLDADGYIDAIKFVFDKAISTASVDANTSNFSITTSTGGTLLFAPFSTSLPGNATSDTDFYLAFIDGVLDTSQKPDVTYVQGTLSDINNNLVDSFYLVGSIDKSGPALINASAADGTTGVSGIQTGDIVRLAFSENTNQPVITAGNINTVLALLPNANTWLSGAEGIQSANWTSLRTLEIKLSTASGLPNVGVGSTTVTASSTTVVTDVVVPPNPSTGAVLLSGDFGLDITSPTIATIETADLDIDGYIDAIHFVMSEPVLDSSISTGAFSRDGSNVWNVFVSTINNDVANDNDFYLTFVDGQFNTAYRPSAGYIAGNLRDPAGNRLASFSPQQAQDKAAPAILAAKADDNSGQGTGIQTNDVVQFIFSEDISNPPVVNSGNVNSVFSLSPSSYSYTWLAGDGSLGVVSWVSASVLIITLSATGVAPRIDPSSTVITMDGTSFKDSAGNASPDSIILAGNFGADTLGPVLNSRETVDSDSDGYIDAIRAVFNESVKDSSVKINNFLATLNGSLVVLTAFNPVYNDDVSNDEKIYLTFQDGVWDTAKTPTLYCSPDTLTDLAGNFLLPISTATASDKASPVLRDTVASDGTTLVPGIDADDTITLTFSEPTRRPAIDSLNIAQVFSATPATHTFGNITAAWDPETQLTVRFTGDISSSTISSGDVISVIGSLIDDYVFNIATGSVILAGSFKGQDAIPPAIINVSPADNSVGISTGAGVTITFSENMNALLVSSAISITAITDSLGVAINRPVSGTNTFSSVSNVLTFSPSYPFAANTTYELKISTLATDTIGNPLASEWRSRFTTQLEYTQTNVVIANDYKTKLDLPPNAIPGNGWVKISLDPVNAPMAVNPAAISAANAKASNQMELTGQQVPGTLREINAYKDGSLWVNSLAAPATITLPYGDTEQDGIVDGSSPPMREDTLEIFYLDEKNNLWVRVPGSVADTQNNIVTVQVSHLSVFALFGAQATDLYSAYAFPVPFIPSEGHQAITFTNLSPQATIEIFTFSGELVRRLENISGANQILWDVTNRAGKEVASGVYLYVIKNAAAKKKGKLMIIR